MIDLIIVFTFIAYSITSGFRARKKASENLTEYLLAGRTIKGWRAGISMAATQYAADTPLLITGLIATGGVFSIWRLWIYGLAFLMMGFLFGKVWRRAKVITDAELTEIRYTGSGVLALRGLKAIYYGTVINCVVMAMVLVAATRIFEIFLPWHLWLPEGLYGGVYGFVKIIGIPISSGVTGFETYIATTNNLISILIIISFVELYSTTGGLRSVIATDVIQFGIMMIATLSYSIISINKAGGLRHMLDNVVEIYGQSRAEQMLSFSPTMGEALFPFFVIIGLQWFFQMNSDGTGYLAQRTMACKTDTDARIAAIVFTFAQIVVRSLIWLPIGIALLVIYPFDPATASGDAFVSAREILFAQGINDLLPIGVRGLMLTGMLAALASTIDTHLNWGASYWSNDIYKAIISEKYLKKTASPKELVIVARLSNVLILLVSLIIMVNLGSIQKAWHLSLLFGAGMGSVLILRWMWERINLFSEMSAIIGSLVFAPVLLISSDSEWFRLLMMSTLSTLTVIIVTLLTPMTDDDHLIEFFNRVQPPGLWKKTALKAGKDPSQPGRDFRNGGFLVLACGATVFLFLIGFGKLLVHMPHTSLLPAFLYILLGLGIIPFWWKKIFDTTKSEKVSILNRE